MRNESETAGDCEISPIEAARRRFRRAEMELKQVSENEVKSGGQILQPTEWHPDPDLDRIFRYHRPSPEQEQKCTAIRSTAKHFAQVVLDNVPAGADRSTAIHHIRVAMMMANAAIALE